LRRTLVLFIVCRQCVNSGIYFGLYNFYASKAANKRYKKTRIVTGDAATQFITER